MTWSLFVGEVAYHSGLTRKQVTEVLRHAAAEIVAETRFDETVRWPALGVFFTRSRKARKILHPVTREPMRLRATKSVGFRPGKFSKW